MLSATVILTSYNRPVLLRQAAFSVINQDYKGNIELIIADDASNPETWAEMDKIYKYVMNNSDLLNRDVILMDSMKGDKWRRTITDYARNINSAILASTGDVIFYLTDDDEFLENHVRLLIEELERNPDAHFVFGAQRVEVLDEKTGAIAAQGDRIWPKYILPNAPNNIDHNQFAHRAEAIHSVGLWPEHKMHYGACDGAFFDQVHKAGYVFYNATMPNEEGRIFVTSRHRIHPTSVQGLMLRGLEAQWK